MRQPKLFERLVMFWLGQLTAKLICNYLVKRQQKQSIVVYMDQKAGEVKPDLFDEVDYFLRKYTNLN